MVSIDLTTEQREIVGMVRDFVEREIIPVAHDLEHDDWLALAGPNGNWDDVPGEADPEQPAPFHIEVPRRLIKLYSYRDDLVGDVFLSCGYQHPADRGIIWEEVFHQVGELRRAG